MSSTPRFNRLGAIAGAVALVALGTIGFGQFNRSAQAEAGPTTPPATAPTPVPIWALVGLEEQPARARLSSAAAAREEPVRIFISISLVGARQAAWGG